MANLHIKLMPKTLNSSLGPVFLDHLYNTALTSHALLGFGLQTSNDELIGFICGIPEYKKMFKSSAKILSPKNIVKILQYSSNPRNFLKLCDAFKVSFYAKKRSENFYLSTWCVSESTPALDSAKLFASMRKFARQERFKNFSVDISAKNLAIKELYLSDGFKIAYSNKRIFILQKDGA